MSEIPLPDAIFQNAKNIRKNFENIKVGFVNLKTELGTLRKQQPDPKKFSFLTDRVDFNSQKIKSLGDTGNVSALTSELEAKIMKELTNIGNRVKECEKTVSTHKALLQGVLLKRLEKLEEMLANNTRQNVTLEVTEN